MAKTSFGFSTYKLEYKPTQAAKVSAVPVKAAESEYESEYDSESEDAVGKNVERPENVNVDA